MLSDDNLAYDNYTLLKEIFLLLDDGDRRVLQTFGLSTARFNTLSHLAKHRALSPTDLSTLLLCDKANVTRLLDSLEKDELITRTQDKLDGRRSHITLSRAGEELWHEARKAHHAFSLSRFECLSPDEQKTLRELLTRLKAALQRQMENA